MPRPISLTRRNYWTIRPATKLAGEFPDMGWLSIFDLRGRLSISEKSIQHPPKRVGEGSSIRRRKWRRAAGHISLLSERSDQIAHLDAAADIFGIQLSAPVLQDKGSGLDRRGGERNVARNNDVAAPAVRQDPLVGRIGPALDFNDPDALAAPIPHLDGAYVADRQAAPLGEPFDLVLDRTGVRIDPYVDGITQLGPQISRKINQGGDSDSRRCRLKSSSERANLCSATS